MLVRVAFICSLLFVKFYFSFWGYTAVCAASKVVSGLGERFYTPPLSGSNIKCSVGTECKEK